MNCFSYSVADTTLRDSKDVSTYDAEQNNHEHSAQKQWNDQLTGQ